MRNRFSTLQMSLVALLVGASFAVGPVSGQQLVGVPAEKAGASKVEDNAKARNRLKLDDGTPELVLSLTDAERTKSLQAVILNRFTPAANQLPFVLESVSIAFRATCQVGDTGLRSSMPFQVVVYVDPTGSGDPANTELIRRQEFNVRPRDGKFQKIVLNDPVTVESGDVWIGYTNSFTSVDDRVLYHAAIDTTNPKGRSWIFYNVSSNFDGDVLENAQVKRTVDEEGIAGNWLIRGRGSVGS